MKRDTPKFLAPYCLLFFLLLTISGTIPRISYAQFEYKWLNIGDTHNLYSDAGAMAEGAMANRGLQWPAYLRNGGHTRAEGFWIGVKNWTDQFGQQQEYFTARQGPRDPGENIVPVSSRLVSRWVRPEITVNGRLDTLDFNATQVDAVDPALASDQMLHQVFRSNQGIEIDRKVYAFTNPLHDDYHLIVRTFTNTGNADADADIELPNQTLEDVMFFNSWRWTGRAQAAWSGSTSQAWGKFSMIDIVGDGKGDYPVDFTAIYSWAGFDPDFSSGNWDTIGSPMINSNQWTTAGDTTGRLAGMSMSGLVVLHADNGPNDASYDPLIQPRTLGWMDMDEPLTADGQPEDDYYERGILTRENPMFVPGGSSRMFPHYANRIEPSGNFWEPTNDASTGKQGGHGATVAYGPYNLNIGQSVTVVEALVANGLSYDAANHVGTTFKRSGFDDDLIIEYDADGDGSIDTTPFNHDVFNNGTEAQTKNQWFFSSRDSMFKSMFLARAAWRRSQQMREYPVAKPPLPPRKLELFSLADGIALLWETQAGAPNPVAWEIFRTSNYVDNVPYEMINRLPGDTRQFKDEDITGGVDYYYYIQAVGRPKTDDPAGLTGTPNGVALRSGRHLTQTRIPAMLGNPGDELPDDPDEPNDTNTTDGVTLKQNYPNPANGVTTFAFTMPAFIGPELRAKLTIYNLLGVQMKVVFDQQFGSGDHEVDVDVSNFPSGTYIYKFETSRGVITKKFAIVRN